jgi:NTP pyrophosphatase (non-canonical NTP hydrolase)
MSDPLGLNRYQDEAVGFDIGARLVAPSTIHALGLAGEAGEVVDILKKHWRDGGVLDVKHLREELGDCLWSLALIAKDYGLTLAEVADFNLAKLERRRMENILAGRRDHR